MMSKKLIGHLKTVLTHKKYVFKYCYKLGIPWQGLVHDLSKFSYIEFSESVKYWTGTKSPINNCKDVNGGLSLAWLHHRGRNLHHYEAWTDKYDSGHPISHMMPWKYLLEMIADYISAGMTYAKGANKEFTFASEYDWWVNGKMNTCLMHENTKNAITEVFEFLKDCENKNTINLRSTWEFISNGRIKENYIKQYNELYPNV